jgi:hypothetical protein
MEFLEETNQVSATGPYDVIVVGGNIAGAAAALVVQGWADDSAANKNEGDPRR